MVESDAPAPQWRPPVVARLFMSIAAVMAAIITCLLIVLPQRAQWNAALTALRAPAVHHATIGQHWLFIILLFAGPLIAALLAYNLLRVSLLIYGWRRYLGRLARELEARLAVRARLSAFGYVPGVRNSLAGTPGNIAVEPLSHALHAHPRLIIAGDDGAGKTVALWRYALDIVRGATAQRIISGRQMVPIIAPLAQYMLADPMAGGLRLGFLADAFAAYGARMLGGQLPALLRRGRVLLLFDGLDDLSEEQALLFTNELNEAVRHRYRNMRIVVTCRTLPLNDMINRLPLLKHLPLVTLLPLSDDEIRQILRRAGRQNQLGPLPADTALDDITERGLLPVFRCPATLAMLIDLVGAGRDIPDSRAHLLRDYETLLFEQAQITGERLERTRRALGYLAVAFRLTGLAEITGAKAWSERQAVKALLADSTIQANALGGNTRPLGFDERQLVEAIDLACMAGVLERGHNSRGLRFRHNLLLYLAAARHLDSADTGLGRVSPTLLRPDWAEILLLWGGLTDDPVGLADRLCRLAKTPVGAAVTAKLRNLAQGEPLALGLALTVGVVRLGPLAITGVDARRKRKADGAQQALRDLFDRVLRYGADDQNDEHRRRLTAALVICEDAAAGELAPALARMVRAPRVNRLLRAQAVQVLGLEASPASLDELTNLLMEPDPIVREALQRGFHLAGAEAAGPLLDLMASSPASETIHRRALEALVAVDGPAVPVALAHLQSKNQAQCLAAVEALGALHDRRALEPLLELLKDGDTMMRLTATRALGRLGDVRAQPELLRLLSASNEEQRIAAAEALGMLRDERAIKPLIKLLDDRQPKVRAAAAAALGHMGDKRAIDALRKRLMDKDAWTQAAAATALRALGQRS